MRRIATLAVVVVCVAAMASLPLIAQQQSYPQQSYPQQPVYNSQYPQTYGPNVIPAGTSLSIRTNENITASEVKPGATFAAEIAQDVMDPNGQLLIPRGSPARLAVVSTGKSTGSGENLALALQSINVNGRTYMVTTGTTSPSGGGGGIGANKRTATHVGGGALLGTLIGAIAGGGKGAAIGAILGAGGGAAVQVLTRGKQINVPAESVLTFRLDQPIQLS